MLSQVRHDIRQHANPEKAKLFQRFFKTGKGEYGEGDRFLGLTVPQCRIIVKKFKALSVSEITFLLMSIFHEERLIALLILVEQFKKAYKIQDIKTQKQIYEFYLANTKFVNNWDLVDLSCHHIVGSYLILFPGKRNILYRLAQSYNMWERRIAIISTFTFIKHKDCGDSLKLAVLLLKDKHDLIHKAVGWMLREVGKNCGESVLTEFLKNHYRAIPRTTLRYAIERYPERKRKKLLKGVF
jgi:3-methyladenine DNA glycosylase AlkD